jgi:hypothetical protein
MTAYQVEDDRYFMNINDNRETNFPPSLDHCVSLVSHLGVKRKFDLSHPRAKGGRLVKYKW